MSAARCKPTRLKVQIRNAMFHGMSTVANLSLTDLSEDDLEEMVDYLPPVIISTRSALDMDDKQFYKFCRQNADLRIERTKRGELIIMAPTGGWTGRGNVRLTVDFEYWSEADGSGYVFDSSTGFCLPNKAVRSPDVSWVLKSRLAKLTRKQWRRFLPLCPDFVLELRSSSDRLPDLQTKMDEYMQNGARLGWLINPLSKEAFIYRPGLAVEHLDNPTALSGESVLPGFTLELTRLWRALDGNWGSVSSS